MADLTQRRRLRAVTAAAVVPLPGEAPVRLEAPVAASFDTIAMRPAAPAATVSSPAAGSLATALLTGGQKSTHDLSPLPIPKTPVRSRVVDKSVAVPARPVTPVGVHRPGEPATHTPDPETQRVSEPPPRRPEGHPTSPAAPPLVSPTSSPSMASPRVVMRKPLGVAALLATAVAATGATAIVTWWALSDGDQPQDVSQLAATPAVPVRPPAPENAPPDVAVPVAAGPPRVAVIPVPDSVATVSVETTPAPRLARSPEALPVEPPTTQSPPRLEEGSTPPAAAVVPPAPVTSALPGPARVGEVSPVVAPDADRAPLAPPEPLPTTAPVPPAATSLPPPWSQTFQFTQWPWTQLVQLGPNQLRYERRNASGQVSEDSFSATCADIAEAVPGSFGGTFRIRLKNGSRLDLRTSRRQIEDMQAALARACANRP